MSRHEIGQSMQGRTLDAVRQTQDAVVKAVTAWTETANKIPGYAMFTKQFPAATEVIDSNFDFVQQLLTSQRDFAVRIVAATAPKAVAPKAEAPKAEAPKAEAPKAEAPKAEAPKVVAPKAEATKAAKQTAAAPKKSAARRAAATKKS